MILALPLATAAPPEACENRDAEGLDPSAVRREYGSADATRRNLAEANEEAQRLAREKLVQAVGSGLTDALRRVVVANIRTRQLPPVSTGGGRLMACAVAFLPRDYANLAEGDMREFDARLQASAREIATTTGDVPVWIEHTRTEEGCDAGPLGRSLDARVRTALAAAHVQLATADNPRVARAHARLDPRGADGVPATLELVLPGAGAARAWDVSFNAAVLVDDPEAAVGRAAIGCGLRTFFPDGRPLRSGREGLRVDALMADTELCEGERIEVAVSTNAPAWVQAFSVEADGAGYLTAPYRPGGQRVAPGEDWRGLSGMALPLDPPREEHLLLAAVPLDESFSATRGWAEWCRAPDGLVPSMFPPGTAFSELRFRVTPAGGPGCEGAKPNAPAPAESAPACR